MVFSWFFRSGRLATTSAARASRSSYAKPLSFRPRLEGLEERTVLSTASLSPLTATTATHFFLMAPENTTVGQSSPLSIVALDASNHVVPSYTGTVTLTSTDGADTLPASYTFTAADHGRHFFKLVTGATGSDTITATDTTTSSITGSVTETVNAAPVVTHFDVVTLGRNVITGQATSIAVVALDASNHPVASYTGTVALTSTDSADTLPASYTFTSSDHGAHVFSVTPGAVGSDTITATDTATSTITGTDTVTVAAAPVVTHLQVMAQGRNVFTGQATSIVVVALDASNHPVAGYTGTVALTSTDSADTLPASYTFTAADHGMHTFSLTPAATGSDTITATDSATSTITGSATVSVTAPATVTHLKVITLGNNVYSGQATSVAVIALDASNHPVAGYSGTVTLTSTDSSDKLPASYTFTSSDHGYHVFSLTPGASGSDTITATDKTTSTITGTATVQVSTPAVATHFEVVALTNKVSTTKPTEVAVVALDASNHIVTGYGGTVAITSSDTGDATG